MNARWTRLRVWAPPIAIAVVFLIAFFGTLSHYGMTWDEPENLLTGEKYFRFLTSGDSDFLRFDEDEFIRRFGDDSFRGYADGLRHLHDASGYMFRVQTHDSFVLQELDFGHPFPPVANIASALTDEVLASRLHVLDPLGAHHAAIGLFWAVLLVAVYRFAGREFGTVAAIVAAGTLALAPRLWGPVHNNIKDVPLTALFGLTLLALHKGVSQRRYGWILGSGALAGLAVGTKLNGAFVFVVAGIWLLGTWRGIVELPKRCKWALLASPVIAGTVLFASWPYLWPDPEPRLRLVIAYGLRVARLFPQRPGLAAAHAFATTPLIVMVFAVIAVPILLSRLRVGNRTPLLIAAWGAVPLIRVNLPGSSFYDGIRQFMEYWPALAIVAGIGAGYASSLVAKRVTRGEVVGTPGRMSKLVSVGIAGIALLPLFVADVRLHPYEDVYFNAVVGGPGGAGRKQILWATDYWGHSYREASRWANEHLEPRATIVAPVAGFLLRYDGLRSDITVYGEGNVPDPLPVGPVYLMYPTRPETYNDLIRACDERKPVFSIERAGLVILKTYRLDGPRSCAPPQQRSRGREQRSS